MPSSNNILRLGLVVGCGCALAGTLAADDLTLADGAHLSGTVRSINDAGVLELASDLSPEPILLKSSAVDKVEFSATDSALKPPSAVVELANGDMLPAAIETLDDRQLTCASPEAGRLEIPRNAVKSLQLGIRQHNVIYAGPRSIDEWTSGGEEGKNWVLEHDSLIASGPAIGSHNVNLPPQFILRFTIIWEARQMPNFQIYFADPLKARGELCNRYYLQFGGAGMEIKREAATGKRFSTIVQLNRNPTLYPDHQLQVELRVDRKNSRLQLLLNGESEGEYVDPIPAVPDGTGITLVCNTQNGSPQAIRNLEVLEFDDLRGRHRAEDRGDPKTDSLISRDDDRWGGRLVAIIKTGDEPVFHFKSAFQNELLEIPATDVSTVFFAAQDSGQPADKLHPLVLRLRGEGALRVTSCSFSGDCVVADHPLLGRLNLRRSGIVAMERPRSKPATPGQP